jgi:hypothetical protein
MYTMMPNFIELEGNFNTVLNKIAQIILIENALIGTLTVSKDEKDVKNYINELEKGVSINVPEGDKEKFEFLMEVKSNKDLFLDKFKEAISVYEKEWENYLNTHQDSDDVFEKNSQVHKRIEVLIKDARETLNI